LGGRLREFSVPEAIHPEEAHGHSSELVAGVTIERSYLLNQSLVFLAPHAWWSIGHCCPRKMIAIAFDFSAELCGSPPQTIVPVLALAGVAKVATLTTQEELGSGEQLGDTATAICARTCEQRVFAS